MPLVAEPDGSDVEPVVRRLGPSQAKDRTRYDGQGGDIRSSFSQETTARDFGVMVMHSVTKES
jgi:hypothetical protein